MHTTYDDLEKLGWDQRILQELYNSKTGYVQGAILCHHVIQIQTRLCQMLYLHDKNSLLRSLKILTPFFQDSKIKSQTVTI